MFYWNYDLKLGSTYFEDSIGNHMVDLIKSPSGVTKLILYNAHIPLKDKSVICQALEFCKNIKHIDLGIFKWTLKI